MKGFELEIVRTPGELTWTNFEEIREELEKFLWDYKGLVYTEETLKDAKADRATLNKLKGKVDDARKEVKKAWMGPLADFEGKAKELVGIIDEQIGEIDLCLSEYERQRKETAMGKIISHINALCGGLPVLIQDKLPDKIIDPRWLNKTAKEKEWRASIDEAIRRIRTDLSIIDERAGSEEEHSLILTAYANDLCLEDALAKARELETQRAVITRETIKADDEKAYESMFSTIPDDIGSFLDELGSLQGEPEKEQRKVLCIFGKGDSMRAIQNQAQEMGLDTWYQFM